MATRAMLEILALQETQLWIRLALPAALAAWIGRYYDASSTTQAPGPSGPDQYKFRKYRSESALLSTARASLAPVGYTTLLV